MNSVPFLDLKRQYLTIKEDVDQAIQSVLDRGDYVLGKGVADFENDFAIFCGVKHCVAVNSGTAALIIALRTLGVGQGDEVLIPSNTFIATAEAVLEVGAVPVLVDSEKDTYLIDILDAQKKVTKKTKAIIPVHLYGQIADMEAINSFAAQHGLLVLEDACQAAGATQNKRSSGSFGIAAAFSFYPGKNLGSYGEGGAIVTNDDRIADEARALRNHGCHVKYVHDVIGYNMRMEGIQGAILHTKLKHLNGWNLSRNEIAVKYRSKLSGVGDLTFSKILDNNYSNYHLFVVETEQREELSSFLSTNGISVGIHYPIPIHLQKAFAGFGYKKGDFPVTEFGCERILSLPLFPEMTSDEVDFVISKIKEFFGKV
jgi:dTDP-4-amino-4,6-dideoxygalactose transaminase